MGNKTLVKMLAALAVVGLLALIVKLTGTGTVDRGSRDSDIDRELVFEELSPAGIARIGLTSAGGTMTLVLGEKGWEMVERGNYPADNEAVAQLIRAASRLKIRQQPALSKSSHGGVQLLDPRREGATADDSATVVSFVDGAGKQQAELWIGKSYEVDSGRPGMFGPSTEDRGRYVRTGDDEKVFIVEETFADLEPEPAGWLADAFFQVRQVKSVALDTGDPAADWKLVRDDADGEFSFSDPVDGEELDTGKVSPMKNAFASPRFEDVLVGEDATPAPDAATFVVETFEGFTYTVKVSEKDPAGELRLTVDVDAAFAEKREPEPEETDEEAAQRDAAFAQELEALKSKLAAEEALEGRVFRTRSFFVDSLWKKRSELLVEAEADTAGGGPGAVPGVGGGLPGLPSATTPIPPAPASPEPTEEPASVPKEEPSAEPTEEPASEPSEEPSAEPTEEPAAEPASEPTEEPASEPSE